MGGKEDIGEIIEAYRAAQAADSAANIAADSIPESISGITPAHASDNSAASASDNSPAYIPDNSRTIASDRAGGNQTRNGKNEDRTTGVILLSVSLTAIVTSVVLIVLLRVFGLLSIAGTVDFRGSGRSVASVLKLQQVWDALSRDYYMPVDEDRMIEFAASAMVKSIGDVYTTYYSKEEMDMFVQHSAGVFHGVGVYVRQGGNGLLHITGFLENSPAQEAGVLIDDEIISVGGVDVTGITDTDMVINMIKGEIGTFVTIGFFRPSEGRSLELDVERREIKTENIISRLIYTGDGGEDNEPVGYIYILMFDGAAFEYFERHLNKLLESGIVALIIDLRNNPGGDYNETVRIADRLIGKGVIVYTEDRAGRRIYSESDEEALGLPIRVLINGDSASASEVLAGAIKDNGAGSLVGSGTFGKGLVQTVVSLVDGSGLKYTSSRYYTPSGVCIDGKGIEPDIYAVPYERDEVSVHWTSWLENVPAGGGSDAINPRNYDRVLDAAISDIEIVIDKANHE
jgi:carboxyl-terminal processing protease